VEFALARCALGELGYPRVVRHHVGREEPRYPVGLGEDGGLVEVYFETGAGVAHIERQLGDGQVLLILVPHPVFLSPGHGSVFV